MVQIPDQGAVEKLAPASADPTFGYRVHPRRLHVAEHGSDPGTGEDGVECSGVVRAAVADHELGPVRLLAEVHDQVPGLLHGPFPGGMQGDAEDADAPGRVLDHGQDLSLGASGRPAVKKPHAKIASAWERRNCGQVGPVRRGAGPVPLVLRISHTVGAATLAPRPASSPWILRLCRILHNRSYAECRLGFRVRPTGHYAPAEPA